MDLNLTDSQQNLLKDILTDHLDDVKSGNIVYGVPMQDDVIDDLNDLLDKLRK